jgi:hypothetical protein
LGLGSQDQTAVTTAIAFGLRPILGFGAADVLFPNGNARLSTIVAFSAFLAIAVVRRSWLPILACLVWLFGFEVALNVTVLALGRPATLDAMHFIGYLVVCFAGIAWLAHRRVRPIWPLLAAAVAVWIAWVATGFHVNAHKMVGFNALAEAWNEGAKTLWALAFILPLMRIRLPLRRRDRGDASRAAKAGTT